MLKFTEKTKNVVLIIFYLIWQILTYYPIKISYNYNIDRLELIIMDTKIFYLIMKNTAKLEKLVETNAPYEKILNQSKKLDKYIMIQMKNLNRNWF